MNCPWPPETRIRVCGSGEGVLLATTVRGRPTPLAYLPADEARKLGEALIRIAEFHKELR